MSPKLQLRRRLYPSLAPSPLDAWCHRGLLALALSGGCAGAVWFQAIGGLSWLDAFVLSFSLLFLPFLTRIPWLVSFAVDHHRSFSKGLYLIAAIVLMMVIPDPHPALWLVFLLLACHGYVLRYARPDNLATVALLLPLVEMQLAHHVLWAEGFMARIVVSVWMLVTVLLAAGVSTWIHARWTRRRLQLRDRNRINPAEDGQGLWARARFMMLLGLLLVPIGLLLQQIALQLPPVVQNLALAGSGVQGSATPGDSSPGPEENMGQDVAEGKPEKPKEIPREFVFPSTISWQGEVTEATRDTVVFHVKADLDLDATEPYYSAARPLYLVATTFDTIDELGLRRATMSEAIYHADSGLGADDWIVFDPDFIEQSVVQYKMRTQPLRLSQGGAKRRYVHLLHDRQMVALRYPSCRYAEDGTALGEHGSSEPFSYQWLSRTNRLILAPMAFNLAAGRHRSLPRGEAFRPWIQAARELCADLEDPRAKVGRIRDHFRHEYTYDRHPSAANGVEAFTDFFTNRRGYCTYFASATMLYLRANDIPCRVATGFMVTEYSDAYQAYVGRLPGHAWVEVLQEDGSWRTLESTPESSRSNALAALRHQQGSADFSEEEAVTPAEEGPEEEAFVAREERALDIAFGGVGFLMMMLSAILVPVVLVLFLGNLFSGFFVRKRERREQREHGADAVAAMDYWGRIQILLESLGFRHRRSQTAAEYAASVERWGGEGYRSLALVTKLVYRSRFGGYPWTQREVDLLERFEVALERKLRENPE